MRRPEDQIQRAVFDHFNRRSAPGVFAFAVPNGGYRRRVEAAILKGLGVKAGVPDVIAIKDGRVFGLELKADKGRLSENQRKTLALLSAAGATVGVGIGLDGALDFLERHNLLRGARQ